jgi:uncharacterized tellurite resistance protein B-like protein
MLNRLSDLFMPKTNPAEQRTGITAPMAACVVLLEAAHADDEFSAEEQEHISSLLQDRFNLSTGEVQQLMADAAAARGQSSDLWRFTRRINETFSNQEKCHLLEQVWQVLYSDRYLHGHEDHLAHKLRDLLNLSQPDLIAAKLRVLDEIRGEG